MAVKKKTLAERIKENEDRGKLLKAKQAYEDAKASISKKK